jgi:hypothetical protein
MYPEKYHNIKHYELYTANEIATEKAKLNSAADLCAHYRAKKKTAVRNSYAEKYYTSRLVNARNLYNESRNRLEVLDIITKNYNDCKKFYKKFTKVLDFSSRV